MSAGEDGRHIVGSLAFFIDIFQEVHNKRYGEILDPIDYIDDGLRSWYKTKIYNIWGNVPKTYFPPSWLSDKSA